jgi:DNA polymerase III delta prime subunit
MELPTTPPRTKPQRGRKRKEVSVPHLAAACDPNIEVSVPSLDSTTATTLKNGVPAQENSSGMVEPITGMPNASLEDENKQSLEEAMKPKKILQLNPKTGTIGSPPKITVPLKKQSKGKISANQDAQPKAKVVVITYGTGEKSAADIGLRIDEILTSEKTSMKTKDSTKQSKPKTSNEVKPAKDADVVPWWKTAAKKKAAAQGEAQESEIQASGKERQGKILSLVNPSCPTKTTATAGMPRSQESKQNAPLFNGFSTAPKIQKFPGAVEPAWPWQGAVHIRGEQNQNKLNTPTDNAIVKKSSGKKSKYQAVEVLKKEDIIDSLATELQISEALNIIQNLHIDEFKPISACLRLPSRHIETGKSLQQRIRKELSCNMSNPSVNESSEDEIQAPVSNRTPVHPALRKIYDSIATSLSPFDKSQCENLPWTQKYAPKSTEEVLHNGRETSILREWLQKLTVLSVESGSTDSKAASKRLAAKSDAPGKRKRKSKKLDGFIVSSDEEDNDMDEITDPEDEASAEDGPGLIKKTVIRSGDMNPKGSKDSKRLTNAVVMSGPHGCGKTATVYAVAKELGFEVFEINSSSRRSGKDVMERVGDMTRNHLVQGPNNDQPPIVADEDEQRLSNAVADDLKTGRQGTMSSFFKLKEPSKPKPKPKDLPPNPPKEVTVPKGPAKQQKQSLILLEEIDILYEEDRGFWQTIMLLIAQSKRPIIMTCNDESAVPLSALSLHAIIRFNSIPTDLATDYMLLVAANEGHALRREAIKALYESRKLDFRGSMTELDFWCQFAVGDRKAGLEWFYPRMPAGHDLDEKGNKNRVVSEDTYRTGMGWFSQDSFESQRSPIDAEEETLRQAWDGWSLDAADDLELGAWALKIKDQTHSKISARAALDMYDDFAEAMSAADCCSYYSLGADKNVSMNGIVFESLLIRSRLSLTQVIRKYRAKRRKTTYLPTHYSMSSHKSATTKPVPTYPYGSNLAQNNN